MSIWKSWAEERGLRKWPNWSAHCAWGMVFVLGLVRVWPLGVALACSLVAGLLWELAFAWLTPSADRANRASVRDWLWWIGGAVVATLFVLVVG